MRTAALAAAFFLVAGLAVAQTSSIRIQDDGTTQGLASTVNCTGALACTSATGLATFNVPTGGGVAPPAGACLAGQCTTFDGTAYACTSTITASDVSCAGMCVADAEIAGVSGAKVSGAVATATALAVNPTDCVGPAGTIFASSIDAQGNLTCNYVLTAGGGGIVQQGDGLKLDPECTPGSVMQSAGATWSCDMPENALGERLTCAAGQAVTCNGITCACTSTLTASDVACAGTCVADAEIAGVSGAKVSGAVATATSATSAGTANTALDLTCAAACVSNAEIIEVAGAKVNGSVNSALTANTAGALWVDGANCAPNQFALGVAANGDAQCAQPAFSDLSGSATDGQLPATISASRVLKTAAFADATTYTAGKGTPVGVVLNLGHDGTSSLVTTGRIFDHTHSSTAGSGGQLDTSSLGSGTLGQARGGTGAAALTCSAGQALTSNGTAYSCTGTLTASDVNCTTCVDNADISGVAGSKVTGAVATATSATALAANPSDCGGAQYAQSIDASGNLTCGYTAVRPNFGVYSYTDGVGLKSECNDTSVMQYRTGSATWDCAPAANALGVALTCSAGQAVTCNGTTCSCTSDAFAPLYFDGAEDPQNLLGEPGGMYKTPNDLTITDPNNYCATHNCTHVFARTGAVAISGTYAYKSQNDGVASSVSSMRAKTWLRRPAVLTFNWTLQSESGWDYAEFYVDGTRQFWNSGMGFSSTQTFTSGTLAVGAHEFVWRYRKDGSADVGTDEFTVDNIKLTPTGGGDVSEWHKTLGEQSYGFLSGQCSITYPVLGADTCGSTINCTTGAANLLTTSYNLVVQDTYGSHPAGLYLRAAPVAGAISFRPCNTGPATGSTYATTVYWIATLSR